MRSHITLIAAIAGACLSAGCVIEPLPPPYGSPVVAVPPDEIIVPDVVIIDGGVRHDWYFYRMHPEIYRRDRMRYPDRFRRPAPRPDYRPDHHRPDAHHPDYRRPDERRPDVRRPEVNRPEVNRPSDPRQDNRRPDDRRKDDHKKKKPGNDRPDAPDHP